MIAAAQHTEAGAQLWTHIGRRLRGQPRAEALTIAAACYCLLEDSVRAAIAARTALDEAEATKTPPPRLALMLLTALRSGMPPNRSAAPSSTPPTPNNPNMSRARPLLRS